VLRWRSQTGRHKQKSQPEESLRIRLFRPRARRRVMFLHGASAKTQDGAPLQIGPHCSGGGSKLPDHLESRANRCVACQCHPALPSANWLPCKGANQTVLVFARKQSRFMVVHRPRIPTQEIPSVPTVATHLIHELLTGDAFEPNSSACSRAPVAPLRIPAIQSPASRKTGRLRTAESSLVGPLSTRSSPRSRYSQIA